MFFLSIIGLYSTFILIISQLLRELALESHSKIIYNALPNVDRLYRLLNDILLVRSAHELHIEYELHEKLIYIYRDPSLLIRITRTK